MTVRAEPKRRYLRLTSWVAETFARQGVETVDLDALFRERSRLERRHPSWERDLHWNETGHAWVAVTLYARIEPPLGSRPPQEADLPLRRPVASGRPRPGPAPR